MNGVPGHLSFLLLLPLLGAVLMLFLPKDRPTAVRWIALLASTATLAVSLALLAGFKTSASMQFVEEAAWVGSLGIGYRLGVDGISLFLVILTALLTPIVILSSWRDISQRVRAFHGMMLLLETGMIGAFISLDLFLFYVFWELMLIPMYVLIGVWGGPRKIYAAVKFVLYTIVGSLLMLVAILVLYHLHHAQTGVYSFALEDLRRTALAAGTQWWLFAAFGLAFAIKVPVWPLHTWLPDAHVEAPTAGSVILAGVLLKMGTYGFLRLAIPFFPDAAVRFQPFLVALAVIGILYGALVAMAQTDIKKLVAYSSVSHLGYVMLGLFSFNIEAFSGALYQMLNHGLSTGALFLLVGILYERRHTRMISDYGGIATKVPLFTAAFLLVTLSSIGLPGLNGFVGEFLILLGAFETQRTAAVLATLGVVLGAVYMLWLAQRFLFGPMRNPENRALRDLTPREALVLVPILVLIVYMGVQPRPFLDRMAPALRAALAPVAAVRGQAAAPAPLHGFLGREDGDGQFGGSDSLGCEARLGREGGSGR
ncbi:MAG: NADH-quinone oxidoreductase subunit M [Candidatus Eisenbacteria bacterium]|nr:NADH-quinone oxidoreductase subunit M [Candidatus Eisenbacteria bacterium]